MCPGLWGARLVRLSLVLGRFSIFSCGAVRRLTSRRGPTPCFGSSSCTACRAIHTSLSQSSRSSRCPLRCRQSLITPRLSRSNHGRIAVAKGRIVVGLWQECVTAHGGLSTDLPLIFPTLMNYHACDNNHQPRPNGAGRGPELCPPGKGSAKVHHRRRLRVQNPFRGRRMVPATTGRSIKPGCGRTPPPITDHILFLGQREL